MSPTEHDKSASAEFVAHVTRAQRRLYAFVYSLLGNPIDAEDVLQETNVVLWEKSDEFEPGTNFMAWAFRVAHFQVMAHRKRRARSRERFDDELIGRLADDAAARFDGFDHRQQALLNCMRKLPTDQRTLIARRYEPGASVNEMAEQQGRTPKALSEALRRIRRTLMECIQRTMAAEEAG